jgi:hypothetical protein
MMNSAQGKAETRRMREIFKVAQRLPEGVKRFHYTADIVRWLLDHTDLQKQRIALIMNQNNAVITRVAKEPANTPFRKATALTDQQFEELLVFVRQLNKEYGTSPE